VKCAILVILSLCFGALGGFAFGVTAMTANVVRSCEFGSKYQFHVVYGKPSKGYTIKCQLFEDKTNE
jgi:hypothetical protein